jgi:hypothetical protein
MATARLDIGGGIVRRAITLAGGKRLAVGTVLTAEDLGGFRLANLRSMVTHKQIEIWPAVANGSKAAASGQRHLLARADGKFDVVQGEIVNTKPLSQKMAEKLVAQGKN